jgi:hypothetical protein
MKCCFIGTVDDFPIHAMKDDLGVAFEHHCSDGKNIEVLSIALSEVVLGVYLEQ